MNSPLVDRFPALRRVQSKGRTRQIPFIQQLSATDCGLLDEATSELDAITDNQVHRNLADLHCTRIVIAHRLSTVRNADIILVLNEGSIVEQGSHEELLANDRYYAALVHSQLKPEEVDVQDTFQIRNRI